MRTYLLLLAIAAGSTASYAQDTKKGVEQIDNIVVIFAENRAFDVLYGGFPGANGLKNAKPSKSLQRDRSGSVLGELPPIWKGLTAAGVAPPVTEAQTAHLPNQPFGIDDPSGFHQPTNVITRDPWHR